MEIQTLSRSGVAFDRAAASPILFNLFLEPLLEWILDTMNSEDDAEAAYADDIMLASPHIQGS